MKFKPFALKRHRALSVLLLCSSISFSETVSAQLRDYLNLPDHDTKPYYLGIGFMYTSSHLQVSAHPKFLQSDSVLYVNPLNSGGFGVSGMFTFRMNSHLELRFAFPEFIFSSNSIAYNVKYPPSGEQTLATKQIQSLLLGFPLQAKFLSDRINNFRVYMLGGINYRYDLASNSAARKAENLVKLAPSDLSVEAGVGFQFFFPVFILTPELKFSEGIKNIHSRDPNLQYSNVIDKIKSRMIVFSIIFEG
ncbi:MAG: outer membrane beta-barrel protein [Bacteroidota bacterium]|nr:outer membrane beta-barrel protein [Bacteroidota bacterium]MDP4218502.1 outer membrane beta-barrel protein [Bacteroidota bacterium]MDP4245842.1 outer membrane beta-barrel protein [Bacteroidota bacterium]MDP4252662.1 outer membrane beta-barrel protein [Bacteroidota bacterium]MDP4256685.1 outer membrane beta-barrel protein [Bacteroidota bacterium]